MGNGDLEEDGDNIDFGADDGGLADMDKEDFEDAVDAGNLEWLEMDKDDLEDDGEREDWVVLVDFDDEGEGTGKADLDGEEAEDFKGAGDAENLEGCGADLEADNGEVKEKGGLVAEDEGDDKSAGRLGEEGEVGRR